MIGHLFDWRRIDYARQDSNLQLMVPKTIAEPRKSNGKPQKSAAHVPQHAPHGPKPAETRRPAPQIDEDLASVIDRWPNLPKHVRQTILTLIQSVSPGERPQG